MQFALTAAKVRLMHKNERLEKHGEDEVLACDLDFEHDASNAILAEFHPDLRSVMYRRPEAAQKELSEDPEHLTELRVPQLGGVVKFSGSQEKSELIFSKGAKKHLVFPEAKITKFSFDCKEGGTVCLRFQAQVHPDEAQSGKLSGLLQDKHCLLSISPSEDSQRPLDA
jgi:hypothetical protein